MLLAGSVLPAASAAAPEACWDEVSSDVDGGGPDVVVGLPRYDLPGKPDAGAIVVYSNVAAAGDPVATPPTARTLITADDVDGLAAQAGARFGGAVTLSADAGDFDDDDHCADLLVGIPGLDVGAKAGAGAVAQLTGEAGGLTGPATLHTEDSLAVPGGAQAGAAFGTEVALEPVETLAVGAPGRDVGPVADAGRVVRIDSWGYPAPEPPEVIEQGGRARGTAEAGDRFGEVIELMTSGTGVHMLVGDPGEDVRTLVDAGAVTLVPREGTATTVHQATAGTGGTAEAGDRFGAALTHSWGVDADFGLFGLVAIGVPGEDLGSTSNAGQVSYATFLGMAEGPLTGMPDTLTQATPGVPGTAEAGDAFGTAMLAGGFGHDDGRLRLVVTAPTEDLGSARDAGLLSQTEIDQLGQPVPGARQPIAWSQAAPGAPGTAESGDRFGSAVAPVVLSWLEDDEDLLWPQLMVAVPGEDVYDVADAGMVHLGENPGAGSVSLVPPVLQTGAGLGLELMRIGDF